MNFQNLTNDLSSSRTRMLLLGTVLAAAVAGPLGARSAHADDSYVRYHFDEPVHMGLDKQGLAILKRDVPLDERADELDAFGLETEAISDLAHADWSLGRLTRASDRASDHEALIADLAAGTTLDFISPVFIDERDLPLIIGPEILVRFHDDVPLHDARALLLGTVPGEISREGFGGMDGAFRLSVDLRSGFEVLEAANLLAQMPEVKWAEPNLIAQAERSIIPNDPSFGQQWGLRNTGQSNGQVEFDMDVDDAWDITRGDASVIVVVLDDGVQQNHPDINQLAGADFSGNGTGGGPFNACDNHGTAVAGCISATFDNAIGVSGVAPNCRVRSAKFTVANIPCDNTGSYFTSDFVDALEWAVDIGASVTNNSNGLTVSSAVDDAYADSRAAGIVHFASSGNGASNTVGYPASLGGVNAVGSVTRSGNLSWFSNTGTGLDCVAPGSSILTTDRTGAAGYDPTSYATVSGTSFASPYAAAVAALVISFDPGHDMPPGIVEGILFNTTLDLGSSGYDTTFGYGMLNARDAVLATFAGQGVGDCFIDNGSPACNGTACTMVICAQDPFCCGTSWDQICANAALNLCVAGNDNCSQAQPVIDGEQATGNLHFASPDGAACTGSTTPDVWYSFSSPCPGTLLLSTCGTHDLQGIDTGMDTVLSVHSSCSTSSGSMLACDDDAGPPPCAGSDQGTQRDSSLSIQLDAFEEILIRVSHYPNELSLGEFVLNVDFSEASCQPSNDHIEDAIALGVPSTVFGSTINATPDLGLDVCGTAITAPGVWYSAIGTGTVMTATTCGDFYNYDTKITVFCGDGDDPVCIDGNDDNCFGGADAYLSTVTWCAKEGAEYLILVHGYAAGQGGFELELIDEWTPCVPDVECGEGPNPADINGDGMIDVDDVIMAILAWGPCSADCPEDVNGDGEVDVDDLVIVIINWGVPG